MGFVINMNDGAAFDGVYAIAAHAESICNDFILYHGHAHKFVVYEVESDFSVRGLPRIDLALRKHRAKPMSREYANGYREALSALRRLAFTKPDRLDSPLLRAWDELDTAFACRVIKERVND